MPELRRLLPTRWWSRFLWTIVSYSFVADFIPVLLLLIINCSGYLPYSDRPGPGWQPPHVPTHEELQFFRGFALLLLPATALYSTFFAVAGLLLGFCSSPRWLVRLLAALPSFLAAGMMMMAAGWMIAIGSIGIYAAACCGLLWGVLVFPLLIPNQQANRHSAVRILLPVLAVVGAVYFLLSPFLPNPDETTATVFVLERTPSGKSLSEVDWSQFGGMPAFDHVPEGLYAPVSISTLSMDDNRHSRVLLLLSDDEGRAKILDVPRTGDAIYSETHGKWTAVVKPKKKASFRLNFTADGGVTADGNCCHGGTSTSWAFPP